ncbi:Nose resistant to fluoxetine protein 6-like Protein [Tribolium castaneum]|uniref:Nose resistant to fluoxetine protein 6-like Protein n=1 Tax=Tribolium castaneum TaxID=7070 RepID=A0A139WIE1_TRICA|nr:Nose resistant to fluoxetine protein 6-like Protein [Tribolium castaneum]
MASVQTFFLALFSVANFVGFNNADGLCDFYESLAYNISAPCLKQLKVVCNNSELAWKMFDASSKFLIPGMTYSNVMDYGNFPECLSINYNNGEILGKYCGYSVIIVNVFLTPQVTEIFKRFNISPDKASQEIPFDLLPKLQNKLRDVLVPDIPFVLSKYSSCVPDACTPREVGYFYLYGHFNDVIGQLFNASLIMYTNVPCETINSNTDYEAGDIVAIVFFVVIGLLLIASTVYEALCKNFNSEPLHPILFSFSILTNGKKLLAISDNTSEQIQCFNGMRFISMMWVLAVHAKSPYEVGIIPLENYPDVKKWTQNWTSQYVVAGQLAVDTFFFMSGFLLAFTYLKKSSDEKFINQVRRVPKMYLHRYLRLTPSVAALYLAVITIFRFFGTGPTWSFITNIMKRVCKDKWWKFFLYVQNYTDPDEMCLSPTWYLSADMQMFILAPFVLIPTALFIKKRFKFVIQGLVAVTIISIVVPILLQNFVDEGPGNLYATHTRFNNYLIGMIFGTTMRMKKQKPYIFKPWTNVALWILVIGVSLAFIIYWFEILGRLSYCMYVLHVMVEFYALGVLNMPSYFSNYMLFYNWCGHIIVTMIFAVVWVLAFEFPMLTIDKYILGDERPRKKE